MCVRVCVCVCVCVRAHRRKCVLHGWFFSAFYIHSQIYTNTEPRAMSMLLCLLILVVFLAGREQRERMSL